MATKTALRRQAGVSRKRPRTVALYVDPPRGRTCRSPDIRHTGTAKATTRVVTAVTRRPHTYGWVVVGAAARGVRTLRSLGHRARIVR